MPIYSRPNDWGGNSISKQLYNHLITVLPQGKTILELGSGWGTSQLMKLWNVWSIEYNVEWHQKYNKTQSLFVPLSNKTKWFSREALKTALKDKTYDLLLVDAPFNHRLGILNNLDLFNLSVPIVLDDVRRHEGRTIAEEISKHVGRPLLIIGSLDSMFGII